MSPELVEWADLIVAVVVPFFVAEPHTGLHNFGKCLKLAVVAFVVTVVEFVVVTAVVAAAAGESWF